MLRVREGELDQLGLLFERYHRLLFRFFFNRNQDVGLSEDLVQNVFVRVLQYRQQFRGDGEFKAWLFHIARNVQHDAFRRKRIVPTEDLENWKDRLPDSDDFEPQDMIRQEEQQQLRAALQKLESDKREILVLAKMKGMKYKAIGELLGLSEGAVKVKVFRALKDLKKQYQDIERLWGREA